MHDSPRSHDRDILASLMQDFPVIAPNPPSLDLALKLIQLRFEKLDTEQFSVALSSLSDEEFAERFYSLPRKVHRYLFSGILSNAGLCRNRHDPEGGSIYFGSNQQFRGANPKKIIDGLKTACSHIKKESNDPISDIVRYYQQFVHVHPFYDANGRIGRFITNIYLDFHGYHISWEKMRRNQKWLKKLNNCHKRIGQESYEKYMQILTTHWSKFITSKDIIDPPL